MRQLRGVAHVHSTYSFDGRMPLADPAVFFREQGIDFVLMSEHVESLDPQKMRSFIADCEALSDDSILLIPGIEIDSELRPNHIVIRRLKKMFRYLAKHKDQFYRGLKMRSPLLRVLR